jgi:hypothetical protein
MHQALNTDASAFLSAACSPTAAWTREHAKFLTAAFAEAAQDNQLLFDL